MTKPLAPASANADGFSIDRHGEINKRGKQYHYIALKEQTGTFAVGSYSGNGEDNRTVDGIGFAPGYLIIESDEKEGPVQRPASLAGDASFEFGKGESFANGIQELGLNGFQVGTDKSVNKDRKTYHWMAFGSPVLADVPEPTPAEFQLTQNFPNPFNPSTRIAFSLPVSTNIRLVVYDVLGRKVRELTSGEFAAGMHSVTWDAMDESGALLSSGVYFARLSQLSGENQQISMIKMLLMK